VDDRYKSPQVLKLLEDVNQKVVERMARTKETVDALIEKVTETASELASVEELLSGYPAAWDDGAAPTEGPGPQEPETDTEATEAVDWSAYPRHPMAAPQHIAARSGANGMKAGDICYDHNENRMCRVDEFLQDGDAYVVYRSSKEEGRAGSPWYGTAKWNALELMGQMEPDVQTHGEDREKESSK
jgi:hypothetical protein